MVKKKISEKKQAKRGEEERREPQLDKERQMIMCLTAFTSNVIALLGIQTLQAVTIFYCIRDLTK